MRALRLRVENGKIFGNAPRGLPDGEHEFCLADNGDDMTDEELGRLNDAIDESLEAEREGRVVPAADVLGKLRVRER